MTTFGSRRPPAPTCEDCWDEDTQDSTFDPRATGAVPIKRSKSTDPDIKSSTEKKNHDGSDSGYSSKAGTSDTMSTGSKKKPSDLKINTKPIERERQPYVFAPNRSDDARPSPTKSKEVRIEKPAKNQSRFQHEYGLCWVCDQYGYHFDISKEMSRPATVAPESQKMRSQPSRPTAKEDSDVRPSAPRRSSSRRESRPLSMFVQQTPYGFPPPVDYSHPEIASNGWQHPPPPMQIPQYPNYQYAYQPQTPLSSSYSAPSVFDAQMQFTNMPENMYRDNNFRNYPEESQYKQQYKSERGLQRAPSHELRPRAGTQKSSKNIEADRRAMPPPPPPKQEPSRPVKKQSIEQVFAPTRRRSIYADDDDDDRVDFRALVSRERRSSQSKPPSAYKTRNNQEYERPRARKSSSYSTPSEVVQVASSREMHRRKTDPAELERRELERKEAELEAYVSKMSKGAVNPLLTAEALRRFEQKSSSPTSDDGSIRSKHSSKESSQSRQRTGTASITSAPRTDGAPRTNITMDNGITFSVPADYGDQPLDIMIGNLRLSMNTNRDDDRPRDLKRIERAPSEVSQASRRSITSGSGGSVSKIKDESQALTREAYRQKASASSSKRSSRAPSTSRRDMRPTDFADLDESYYYAYGA